MKYFFKLLMYLLINREFQKYRSSHFIFFLRHLNFTFHSFIFHLSVKRNREIHLHWESWWRYVLSSPNSNLWNAHLILYFSVFTFPHKLYYIDYYSLHPKLSQIRWPCWFHAHNSKFIDRIAIWLFLKNLFLQIKIKIWNFHLQKRK